MSTNHKQLDDKFAAALKRKPSTPVTASSPPVPASSLAGASASKATFLPPILCVECPACHSRVHPRVRTFAKKADGFDEVRGMCPNCGGVYWVYNREHERFTSAPAATPPRSPVRYVYRPQ